jgi:hypothetical protein
MRLTQESVTASKALEVTHDFARELSVATVRCLRHPHDGADEKTARFTTDWLAGVGGFELRYVSLKNSL